MDTYPDNWPRGFEGEPPEKQSERDWFKQKLIEIQEDQALYSQLKDAWSGKDWQIDLLLEQIQTLQLDIIQIIGKELTK